MSTTSDNPFTVITGERANRVRIQVSSDPDAIRVIRDNIHARTFGEFYVHEGTPVLVEEISGNAAVLAGDDDAPPPVEVTEVRPPILAALLAERAEVVRIRSRGSETWEEEVCPTASVLTAALARRDWPKLPVLTKIVTTPVLRADGTLLQEPGYDARTGYYLAARAGGKHLPHVPAHPTPEQVGEAKEFILNVFLRDFPWRTTSDKANYFALMATPILRPFLRCPMPFTIVDATMPGSGKTILTSCIGLLVGQRVLTWTDSEEELRKTITTVLGDPCGVIIFDNLMEGAVINSAVLARLVTERTWTDRKLGSNQASSFDNDRLWAATGNNLHTGADMASRSVWVRLDPDCPNPETRTGFSIPNLDNWIMEPANQAKVLRYLLILIVDWTNAGAPSDRSVPTMRQFTTWAQRLGGFCQHHGIDGFLLNAKDSQDLDDDAAEWRAFLKLWAGMYGNKPMSAHMLRESAEPQADGSDQWFGTFPTGHTGRTLTPKALGRRLSGQVGRWRTDVVLRSAKDPSTNARVYFVETVEVKNKPGNPETRNATENTTILAPGFELSH